MKPIFSHLFGAAVLLFSVLFISCDKADSPEPVPGPDGPYVSEVDEFLDVVCAKLDAGESSAEELAITLKGMEGVTDIDFDTDANILYVTYNGQSVSINLEVAEYEEPATPEELEVNDHMLDSIAALYPQPEGDAPQFQDEPNTDVDMETFAGVQSRSAPRKRYLTKRRLLLFSPDPQLRREDSTRVRRAIARQARYAGHVKWDFHRIKTYGPGYFKIFNKYDIVVIGGHGDGNGCLFVPSEPMSDGADMEYDILAREPMKSGVRAGTQTSMVMVNGKTEPISRKGYYLGEKFFVKYLPTLENTVVWAVKCHSGKLLGELRSSFVVKKDVADYFGADKICRGKDVYNIFDSYFYALTQGQNSGESFANAPDAFGNRNGVIWKKLSNGAKFNRECTHYVVYRKPQATGVKTLSRAVDETAPEVLLGISLRYDTDSSGRPLQSGNAGVIVTEKATGDSEYISATDRNIVRLSDYRVGEGFMISELAVKADNLKPSTDYIYSAYIETDKGYMVSDESYEFRSGESDEFLIYTEDDYHKFYASLSSNNAYKGCTVRLMNDIVLTKSESEWDSFACHSFYGIFDGGGHIVEYSSQLSLRHPFIDLIDGAGTLKNVTFKILSYQGYNYSIIFRNQGNIDSVDVVFAPKNFVCDDRQNLIFVYNNNGVISKCSLLGTSVEPVSFVESNGFENHNARIDNCSVKFTYKDSALNGRSQHYFCGYNYGIIENIISNINGFGSFVDYNQSEGVINNIEMSGEVVKYEYKAPICSNNNGRISNCTYHIKSPAPDLSIQWPDSGPHCLVECMYSGILNNLVNYSDNTIIVGTCSDYTPLSDNKLIENCHNLASRIEIFHSGAVGGIIGHCSAESTGAEIKIKKCSNHANIILSHDIYEEAGGIVGRYEGPAQHLEIMDCLNNGNIISVGKDNRLSGIAPYGRIINCENTGTIEVIVEDECWRVERLGQIISELKESTEVNNCKKNGKCIVTLAPGVDGSFELWIDGVKQ